MLRLEDKQVDFLCNHLGHSKDIHKNIYRQGHRVTDMTEVSRILQAAIGGDAGENDENETLDEEDAGAFRLPEHEEANGLDVNAEEAPVDDIDHDNGAGD